MGTGGGGGGGSGVGGRVQVCVYVCVCWCEIYSMNIILSPPLKFTSVVPYIYSVNNTIDLQFKTNIMLATTTSVGGSS